MSQETMTIEQCRAAGLLPAGDAKAVKPARKVTQSDRERLENAFLAAWRVVAKDLPEPEKQFKFHETRKWRLDFAWESGFRRKSKDFIDLMVAVEIQGGSFVNGGHNRGSQQAKDHEKLNAAQAAGWVVLQYGTKAMKDPYKVAAEVAEVIRQKCNQGESP